MQFRRWNTWKVGKKCNICIKRLPLKYVEAINEIYVYWILILKHHQVIWIYNSAVPVGNIDWRHFVVYREFDTVRICKMFSQFSLRNCFILLVCVVLLRFILYNSLFHNKNSERWKVWIEIVYFLSISVVYVKYE